MKKLKVLVPVVAAALLLTACSGGTSSIDVTTAASSSTSVAESVVSESLPLPGALPASGEADTSTAITQGTAAAVVSEDEVTVSNGFVMDFPAGWSYVGESEADYAGVYIFSATNRITDSSITIIEPTDTEGAALDEYAAKVYQTFDELLSLYDTLGITAQLQELQGITLAGQPAWRADVYASSTEAEFTLATYIVQAPNGTIYSILTISYDAADTTVINDVLSSLTWE